MPYQYTFTSSGDGDYLVDTAGETLEKFKLVYRADDDTWKLADADAVATMLSIGLTLSAIGEGMKGKILLKGYVADSTWAWTRGGSSGIIYASTTAGELTQTVPSGIGDAVQPVANAFSATSLWFDPAASSLLGTSIGRGTASITSGNTTVTVTHGLSGTPSSVVVTPQDEVKGRDFWVHTVGAATFVIEISQVDLVDAHGFYWVGVV